MQGISNVMPRLTSAHAKQRNPTVTHETGHLEARNARSCNRGGKSHNAIAQSLHAQPFLHNPIATLAEHSSLNAPPVYQWPVTYTTKFRCKFAQAPNPFAFISLTPPQPQDLGKKKKNTCHTPPYISAPFAKATQVP